MTSTESKINNAALIYVRLDSKRLPQKALKKLGTRKLIEFVIERVKKSNYFEPIIVTTERQVDEPLIEIACSNCIKIFRGDIDVAKRTKDCIEFFNIHTFARVNGDSPFTDWQLLDAGYLKMLDEKSDFVTNLVPRTFPYGVSVEIIKAKLFTDNYSTIKNNIRYSEHITSYFYDKLSDFKVSTIENKEGNQSQYQLTIDTFEHLNKIRELLLKSSNNIELSYKQAIDLIQQTDD